MRLQPTIRFLLIVLALQEHATAQQPNSTTIRIQSAEWEVAVQEAKEALARRDVATLILGLQHPDTEVRKQCALDINDLGDSQAVPALVAAWTFNRTGLLGPNGKSRQDQLDLALMIALVHLTGQSIDTTKPLTFAQMQAVIQASKNWAAQHGLSSS